MRIELSTSANTVGCTYQTLEMPSGRPLPPTQPVTIVILDGTDGREHWLAFRNFYAITRYNISKHYAMAVNDLAEAIAGRPMPSVQASNGSNGA